MARPAKLFPSYRKHRASGQAVVTIGTRDFYLGPHGTDVSKQQYDRLVMEWVAAGRTTSFGTPESTLSITDSAEEGVQVGIQRGVSLWGRHGL